MSSEPSTYTIKLQKRQNSSQSKHYELRIKKTTMEVISVRGGLQKLKMSVETGDLKYSVSWLRSSFGELQGIQIFRKDSLELTGYAGGSQLFVLRRLLEQRLAQRNVFDNIQVIETIKQTKSSKILLVHENGQQYAMKVMPIEDPQGIQELEIMMMLNHEPHSSILKMIKFFVSESHLYMIFEYCAYGTLHDLLSKYSDKLPMDVVQSVMLQLLEGINHLHSLNVAHKDLKFDNIIIESMDPLQIKIIDFGLSSLRGSNMNQRCGTSGYIAPEVFSEEDLTDKVDIFSAGSILHKLLTAKNLFANIKDNSSGVIRIHSNVRDQEALDLLYSMLSKNPIKRFCATDCLAHPFFTKESITSTSTKQQKIFISRILFNRLPQMKNPFQSQNRLPSKSIKSINMKSPASLASTMCEMSINEVN